MPRPDLLFIRHAPVADPTRLWGRAEIDVAPFGPDTSALRDRLPRVAAVVASPARRCVGTAGALFPGQEIATDARLIEQDFGRHDGAPLVDLPDLGPLNGEALARHAWEGGESFVDLVDRVAPALAELSARALAGRPVAIVAHAGTIRAALAAVTGPGPALAFEIAPLSLTRLTPYPGGFAIGCVNETAR